jgi:tripartite-type tricarboxylate transporter receptor subunit TctC
MSSLWDGGRVVVRAVAKIVVAVTGIVTTIAPAIAQNWPTRPLTIVYPFAAGSAGDVLGRILATHLSDFWANQ